MINIKGIDKARLLAALVNAANPLGLGMLQDRGHPMSEDEAQEIIDKGRFHDSVDRGTQNLYFDYVWGRPIKSNLSGDEWDSSLYDRDQQAGLGAAVVVDLRGMK